MAACGAGPVLYTLTVTRFVTASLPGRRANDGMPLVYIGTTSILAIVLLLALVWPNAIWSLVVVGPRLLVGIHDSLHRSYV